MAVLLVPPSLGAASWNFVVAEALGRIDPEVWESDNPTPPPPVSEPGLHDVSVVDTRRVVPSEGLPESVAVQAANNNLDVVRHSDGRVYMAFRTAPHHFADPEVELQVVSSTDELEWRHEATFALRRDLREPVFLTLGDRLILYFARLGKDPLDFEPDGFSMSEQKSDGTWSEPVSVDDAGRIPWSARSVDGIPVLVAYQGGENIYSPGAAPIRVEFLTTGDGATFRPLNPERPVVAEGGASETDFVIRNDGSLFAVMRNEAGDDDGYGSKLCRAPARDVTALSCTSTPYKYDSPLVFEHDGEVYVVARRNVTAEGRYDVASGPRAYRTIRNQLAYITTAKRCSLYRYDEPGDRLAFVLDLPSRGDTCFPAVIAGQSADELVIYNYSSDVDGPELPWAAGQRRETYVYRHALRFARRGAD